MILSLLLATLLLLGVSRSAPPASDAFQPTPSASDVSRSAPPDDLDEDRPLTLSIPLTDSNSGKFLSLQLRDYFGVSGAVIRAQLAQKGAPDSLPLCIKHGEPLLDDALFSSYDGGIRRETYKFWAGSKIWLRDVTGEHMEPFEFLACGYGPVDEIMHRLFLSRSFGGQVYEPVGVEWGTDVQASKFTKDEPLLIQRVKLAVQIVDRKGHPALAVDLPNTATMDDFRKTVQEQIAYDRVCSPTGAPVQTLFEVARNRRSLTVPETIVLSPSGSCDHDRVFYACPLETVGEMNARLGQAYVKNHPHAHGRARLFNGRMTIKKDLCCRDLVNMSGPFYFEEPIYCEPMSELPISEASTLASVAEEATGATKEVPDVVDKGTSAQAVEPLDASNTSRVSGTTMMIGCLIVAASLLALYNFLAKKDNLALEDKEMKPGGH